MILFTTLVEDLKGNSVIYIYNKIKEIKERTVLIDSNNITFYGDCHNEMQLCFLEKITFDKKQGVTVFFKGQLSEETDSCFLNDLPLETIAQIADYIHLLPAKNYPF